MPVKAGVALALAGAVALGCGSRTEPLQVEGPAALSVSGLRPECLVDSDCEYTDRCQPQRCVAQACVVEPVRCEDNDPCTEDSCDGASGACVFAPLTADEDGDGYNRPLPGFAPGAPGSCGDDCNDQSAVASPGGAERCDGVDNDCDGIVDNGSLFSPMVDAAILLSTGARRASPGGLSYSDTADSYGAVFTQSVEASQNTFASIAPRRGGAGSAVPVTDVNNDTFAGPLVGRGQIFATAWEDRRDDDYEIYFNRLNTRGEKLGPDLRISRAPGFSLRPALLEVPTARAQQYRLAWEDERGGRRGRIYGQRINSDGQPDGDNLPLSPERLDASSPSLALGAHRIGLLFNASTDEGRGLGFMSFDFDLADPGVLVPLAADNPDGAGIVSNAGRFIVAWHLTTGEDDHPGAQIWGSAITEEGEVLIPPRPLTDGAEFARSHSLVPLGDRLILLWSEFHDGGYDIFTQELSPELEPLGERQAVTDFPTDAYGPLAAFGPLGEIGIMFTGLPPTGGPPQVYFTSLSCDAEPGSLGLPR